MTVGNGRRTLAELTALAVMRAIERSRCSIDNELATGITVEVQYHRHAGQRVVRRVRITPILEYVGGDPEAEGLTPEGKAP